MKKIICFGIACATLMGFGFRVTKDHGYGIQTFENSKTGQRGISFDGGNTWHRNNNETSKMPYDNNISISDQDAFNDAVQKILREEADKGRLFRIVGSGMAREVSGKLVNIAEKTKSLSTVNYSGPNYIIVEQKDWEWIKPILMKVYEDKWNVGHAFMGIGKMNVKYMEDRLGTYKDTNIVNMYRKLIIRVYDYGACRVMKDLGFGESGKESVKDDSEVKYIAPKMFAAEMPKMQKVKWNNCECEISTLYSGEYEFCKRTHWSVSIWAKPNGDDGDRTSFYGYVSKSSSIGKKISSILSDGKEHKIGLIVRYSAKAEDEEYVEIVDYFEK